MPGAVTKPQPGKPPLELEFGLAAAPRRSALAPGADAAQREASPRRRRRSSAATTRSRRSSACVRGLARAVGLAAVKHARGRAPGRAAVAQLNLGLGRSTRPAATRTPSPPGSRPRREFPTRRTASTPKRPPLALRPGLPYLVLDSSRRRRSPSSRPRRSSRRASARAAKPTPGRSSSTASCSGTSSAALRRARVRRRGQARAERPDGADRRRRRRASRRRNPAQRSAGSARSPALPERPRSSASTSACSCSGRGSQKAATQLRLAVADGPSSIYAKRRRSSSFAHSAALGLSKENMSRTAYGGRVPRMA